MKTRLRFICKIFLRNDVQQDIEDMEHEVTWYDGPPERKLKVEILQKDDDEAYLENTGTIDNKIFTLGKNVSKFSCKKCKLK